MINRIQSGCFSFVEKPASALRERVICNSAKGIIFSSLRIAGTGCNQPPAMPSGSPFTIGHDSPGVRRLAKIDTTERLDIDVVGEFLMGKDGEIGDFQFDQLAGVAAHVHRGQQHGHAVACDDITEL